MKKVPAIAGLFSFTKTRHGHLRREWNGNCLTLITNAKFLYRTGKGKHHDERQLPIRRLALPDMSQPRPVQHHHKA
ncbi:MAG: hypothetical protein K6F46_01150, partial [Desulfovibrio sp.]|nr:hypothetical protein [Desulfovibrio sp.]